MVNKLITSTIGITAALIAPALAFSLFSTNPDCGSADTQTLVLKIAKDHPDNKLIKYAVTHSQSLQSEAQNLPSSKSLKDMLTRLKSLPDEINQLIVQYGTNVCYRSCVDQMNLLIKNVPQCQVLAPYQSKQSELQNEQRDLQQQSRSESATVQSDIQALANKAKEGAEYALNTIRMIGKNSDTGAVSCAANLSVQVAGDTQQMNITFTVEETTDEKLYATVQGLQ